METVNAVLALMVGNAVILGVLGYVGRSLFERLLSRSMKNYETDLKLRADTEMERLRTSLKVEADTTMERLKSDLQRRSMEHQARFTKLHVKSAEVIEKMNSLLGEAVWAAERAFAVLTRAGDDPKKEKLQALDAKLVELFRYIDQHRIYLSEQASDMVENIAKELRKHMIFHDVYDDVNQYAPTHVMKEKNDGTMAAWEGVKVEVPEARKKLEAEFRVLLGH